MSEQDDRDRPLTFWQMIHSILAAAIGVQSGKNRSRDFSRGKPSHFIAMGVLFTALFVVVIISIVKLVLYAAGV